VLLVAKNLNAANKLTKAFKENKITKEYIALLDGKINLGKIKKYQIEDNKNDEDKNHLYKITSDLTSKDEKVKKAVTCFSIEKYLSSQNASLVKFMPQTGRMHQLRIHASTNIGNAIIGDKKYNPNYHHNQKQNHNKYMKLHAKKIILDQSIFGKKIIIDAPIPQYFNI
jgi:23S rRNA-/tRNA-specific pseudouridylate synthase